MAPALRKPAPLIAMVVLGTICLLALAAPLVAPYPPDAIDLGSILTAPSAQHWAGTDDLGRDVLSRLLWGARPSLSAGLAIVLIGAGAGLVLGSLSGLVGGWVDAVIMRLADVMLALPGLVVAMALTAALGPSLFNAALALGVLSIPAYVRVARGQALALRRREHVEAARLQGAGTWWLVRKHVVPNVLPALLIYMTFHLGGAVLASSALSFIGLGMQPPHAEWGAMIGSGRDYLLMYPWLCLAPGLAILATAMSVNFLGDALRDVLDPKNR